MDTIKSTTTCDDLGDTCVCGASGAEVGVWSDVRREGGKAVPGLVVARGVFRLYLNRDGLNGSSAWMGSPGAIFT